MKQESRVFWRKTQLPRIKLSGEPVNPKWPNFATENQLPSRDTQRKLSDLQPMICNNDGVKIGQLPAIGHQKPAEFYCFLFSELEILLQKG
jgi:hypothetical protein